VTDKSGFQFWLLIGVLLVSACTVKLESAELQSSDLTFTALDGSFKVRGGEDFRIPDDAPYCYDNSAEAIGSIFKAKTPIVAQAAVGRKKGGKPVRIDIAGDSKPLYGVLLFCSMPSSALRAWKLNRRENIEVPQHERRQARAGKVALVRRIYRVDRGFVSQTRFYTWLLWLADKPEKLN
jgi:hypothetical protein